jgi:hypothetical protein
VKNKTKKQKKRKENGCEKNSKGVFKHSSKERAMVSSGNPRRHVPLARFHERTGNQILFFFFF